MERMNNEIERSITHEEAIRRRGIFNKTKLLIKIISGILLLVFGWLNFKDLPYIALIDDDLTLILLQLVLAIYFISWIRGTMVDLKDEEYTFLLAPNKGKMTSMAVGTIFMLGALFAILCWTHNNFKIFSIALFVFFLIDKMSNIYLVNFVKPTINNIKRIHSENGNYTGYLSVETIEEFLSGKYINWRFAIGISIISILILFSYTNIPSLISSNLNIQPPKLILVLLVLLYVFVIESWIWYKRLKRKIFLEILEKIKANYNLTIKNENNEG